VAEENSHRLLAIDDDPAALEIIRVFAEAEGFEFEGFADGASGMAALADFDPDVVCLDVQLPDTTGYELCRQIKSDGSGRLLPILLITSLNDRDSKIKGIEAGCDDFLTKPFDRVELAARARVLARMNRLNRHLEEGESVMRSFALSVEARDQTTGGHCERVGQLASKLGEWLKLPSESIFVLQQAGFLHDVGKIGVPDAILLKPSSLTGEEWEIMRTHSVIGESIVRPLRSMSAVCPIVRHHHEKCDGSGYPDGLTGQQIPLEARVFQIVDAFDALTNDRPYRTALSSKEALDLLIDEARSEKWDREITNVFADGISQDKSR